VARGSTWRASARTGAQWPAEKTVDDGALIGKARLLSVTIPAIFAQRGHGHMGLTINDITAIHQLYSAYCLAIDDGDGKAFSACFTSNGSVGGVGDPISGTERLTRFAEKASRTGVRHIVANVHVDGDGDEAQGRAYFIGLSIMGAERKITITGSYRDTLRRVDGVWLFEKRAFTMDS